MLIEKITVQNYGAFYGEHEFQLDCRGLTLVMGINDDEPRMNSNGSGKSTLFDALDWALFGVVPRKDHADSIVNEESGKDCEVTVELCGEDGEHIMVRRYRKMGKANGVMFVVNGVEKTALDTKETQRLIELALGMDRDVFHAAVLFGQMDLFRFADSTDSERMVILTKILQLSEVDEWQARAKELVAAPNAELRAVEHAKIETEGAISSLEGIDYSVKITEWDLGHAAHVDESKTALAQAIMEVESLRSELPDEAEIKARWDALQSATPQFDTTRWLDAELNNQHAGARAASEVMHREWQAAKAVITKMESVGEGQCSRCGQIVTAEHLATELESAQHAEIDAAEKLLKANEAAQIIGGQVIARDQAMNEAQAAFQTQQREHAQSVSVVNAELLAAQQMVVRLNAVDQSAVRMQEQLNTLASAVNPYREQEEEKARLMRDLQGKVARLSAQQVGYQEQCDLLEFWIEALGAKGLKSYILDSRLQEMTDAANEWVKVLTGGTIWIRFETQTEGRSTKKLSNKINIRVFRYNPDGTITERGYRSWSGGEKHRVSLAIDFGLSRLIAARAKHSYDILILDELFKHLDQSGREAIVEMLQILKLEKTSVFVVDHDSEFQGAFENRVFVRKTNGRSMIHEEKSEGTTSDAGTEAHAAVRQVG